ncbi:MAG: hypothetical protein BMS9Abin15_0436 [Gammaproteobacteria bacterium]|nr:MAG: hypothetical protein BMS9Abin15_0436 [Gammaproteobacteria bacterium]
MQDLPYVMQELTINELSMKDYSLKINCARTTPVMTF